MAEFQTGQKTLQFGRAQDGRLTIGIVLPVEFNGRTASVQEALFIFNKDEEAAIKAMLAGFVVPSAGSKLEVAH